jgi:hypothetical protein
MLVEDMFKYNMGYVYTHFWLTVRHINILTFDAICFVLLSNR